MKRVRPARERRRRSAGLIVACSACLILVRILSTVVYSPRAAVAAGRPETSIPPATQWPMGGQNLSDTRNQASESTIGPSNVSQLAVKWAFTTGGGVAATPAVVNGVVYFGDMSGNFYALNASNGALVWSHRVIDWTGVLGDQVRDDPAFAALHPRFAY